MSSKLILPVALGLSMVTVTAVLVYYIFKKDEDETSADKSVKTSRVNVIEINVPKSIVPALIGRSGSNIKEIEKKSGALINFKKFSDKDYDTCIIRGRSQATQLAETLVHDFIQQQPLIVEDNLIVPGWACGRIIGTGGESINEISHRSGARVKIEGLAVKDNTQRAVSLKGTKEQIALAKKLIEDCVAQEKCRREIEQSKRSPRHVNTSQPQSPTASEHPDEIPGDRKPTKYKRPAQAGASIEVYVSAVSSPSRFWVQLVGGQVAQLDDLVASMTDYYSRAENRENHKLKQVSVGQVVAAVFRHDGRWYRARVHDIRPNEFDHTQQVADVFFVDYGDSEYVATHELCELRADLLRLRFQAMECFLAGVKPAGKEEETVVVTTSGQHWDKWHPQAIERFEQLTKVAQWKPLVSRTCTYMKTASGDGDRDKEIPGIRLFDVTEDGEIDIGATLIEEGWAVATAVSSPRTSPPPPQPATPFGDLGNSSIRELSLKDGEIDIDEILIEEGWAVATAVSSPRTSPPPPQPSTPFGDLGNSRVLGMLSGGGTRASSLPKDHKDDKSEHDNGFPNTRDKENDRMTTSKSHSSGLEKGDKTALTSVSNVDLTYPTGDTKPQPHMNGSHDLIHAEKHTGSTETLTPHQGFKTNDDLKANMNRMDSHHNLSALGKEHQ